jgi:phosphoserine aminotransferase
MWTGKALGELKKGILHRVAASTEAVKFTRVPHAEEISLTPDASYVYMCTNNTIEGTQWSAPPETRGVPLVADMSSDIASRSMDVKKFGLIFAGAQKNLGPSGATVVIVRKDLAERADKNLPTVLQYRTHIKERSLYHTPPSFAIYVIGLVMDWFDAEGGISVIERRNAAKAALLYDVIDSSGGFYACPVEKSSRSKMNVVFRVAGGVSRSAAAQGVDRSAVSQGNEALEKEFLAEVAAAGIVGVAGHRSVGGMRVSLYNAVRLEAVETMVSFLREFQRTCG